MNFVRLSHDRVTYDVDRNVSTAILPGDEVDCLLFVARWYAAIGAFRSSFNSGR